jgi:hypothetical protein
MSYWFNPPIEAIKEALGCDTATAKAIAEMAAEDDKRETDDTIERELREYDRA